jgi:hypothetical protein
LLANHRRSRCQQVMNEIRGNEENKKLLCAKSHVEKRNLLFALHEGKKIVASCKSRRSTSLKRKICVGIKALNIKEFIRSEKGFIDEEQFSHFAFNRKSL